MIKRRFFFTATLMLFLASRAHSIAFHDREDIRHAVELAMHVHLVSIYGEAKTTADINISVSNLDSRLSLAQCPTPLLTNVREGSYGNRNISVKVNCPSATKWTIYVPTTIDIYTLVAVSSRALRKGDRVSESDFSLRRTNTSSISHEYFDNSESLIGKEVRSSIRPGSVIRHRDVQEANVVRRGDIIVITAKKGAIEVTSSGTAMSDGRIGQQIKVKNSHSKRIVDAVISGPGEVLVRI